MYHTTPQKRQRNKGKCHYQSSVSSRLKNPLSHELFPQQCICVHLARATFAGAPLPQHSPPLRPDLVGQAPNTHGEPPGITTNDIHTHLASTHDHQYHVFIPT